jgi:HAD superfamily hydrolase (TIGR01509 family)
VHAVLFDLDGVIVDSRDFHMEAWERWAQAHDITHEPGYFHRVFGMRNDAIIGGILPVLDTDDFRQLADDKEARFRDAARGRLVALPGTVAFIDALEAAVVPQAIVTSTPRANLDMILGELGLASRFQALVAEEDTSHGKPDPAGFLLAASRLGVEPGLCVVIEDAPAGIAAAKSGGMAAIGLTTTHPAADLRAADLVAGGLDDPAVRRFVLG